ncbi:hypothetical protein GGI21_000209 [Coemansia aciculifera]|nr:hypothetical protein GGI21_000209 [Coemansia aciculifera]
MVDLGMLELRYANTVDYLPQLSSLSLCIGNIDDLRTSLVHKSAATLVSLDVGISEPKMLVYDINNKAIVYSNLRRLKAFSRGYTKPLERPLLPDIAPFPALTSLRLCLTYPFGDDVVFRGSSATLEYLKISIDKETTAILSNSPELKRGFKCLRRVDIGESQESGSDLVAVPDKVMNSLLCILLGAARSVRFSSEQFVKRFVSAEPQISGFEHIQELHFYMTKLTLYGMLGVLSVFPQVTKLTCGTAGMGSELSHISGKELPDYIVATYGSMGNSLYELRTSLVKGVNVMEVANFIMNLALACPNLRKVGLEPVAPQPYYAKIAKSISRKPFSEYASDLKRLLKSNQK